MAQSDLIKMQVMAIGNLKWHPRLQELLNSGFEITKGEDDIISWKVKDVQGKRIGEVQDLLFDTQSEKVRYLILNLEGNELGLKQRKVLVPIGLAQIHEDGDYILLQDITPLQLETLPDYIAGNVNPGVENMVRHILIGEQESASGLTGHIMTPEEFYAHPHFENRLSARRLRESSAGSQTVIAFFDDSMEAEGAVRELLINGFMQENIDLSSGNLTETAVNPQNITDDRTGITNLLSASVNEENELKGTPPRGMVVTVQRLLEEEAHLASEILKGNGAVEVNET